MSARDHGAVKLTNVMENTHKVLVAIIKRPKVLQLFNQLLNIVLIAYNS